VQDFLQWRNELMMLKIAPKKKCCHLQVQSSIVLWFKLVWCGCVVFNLIYPQVKIYDFLKN
jgi:hypothetical protein